VTEPRANGALDVRPRVSVIIPCRNESQHIADCLDSVLATAYPRDRLQVIVADGLSDDGTRQIVADYARRHPCIQLVDNTKRITPSALNAALGAATGDVVVRMDSHTRYPSAYIPRLIEWLQTSGADNVGGVCMTRAANDGTWARAIAVGLAHPFGVGNSYFRIGVDRPRWVDTVPFGCYRRDVFKRIGLFDEELVRNQDDEFNLRLIRAGGRILLVPDVVSEYQARASLGQLWRMYYQYGYFKPLVIRKVGRVLTARQLAPATFVLVLTAAAALALWIPGAGAVGLAVLLAYAVASAAFAARAARRHGTGVGAALMVVFAVLHVSYGVGFLARLFDLAGRTRRRGDPASLPLSR
jgi:glycosyltransferase involved in cell wall biosynthesis